MTKPDSQKVAIITGASQGIGAGLVAGFRQAGYAVVGTSRSIRPSDESGYLTVQGDIGEAKAAKRVVEHALDRFGRIDSLINNAGIFISKPFTDYSPDDDAAITAVNLAGFFHITQLAIRHMVDQGSGHIVNITTSIVDRPSSERPSALVALTKGGLAAVTRSLAIEYASRAGERGCARSNQDASARARLLQGSRRASSPRPARRGQRRGRRDPVPGAGHLCHGRGPSHRRRPGSWTLSATQS